MTPEAWLLDTNILLRMSKSEDPSHAYIVDALRKLAADGARICFTSQILGEFWNVATRPREQNGFGLTIAETSHLASEFERDLEFLPDNQAVHDRWRVLLEEHEVKGVQVHDARLAASMYVHGISNLLTFNVRDFQRFTGLRAVHPAESIHGLGKP